MPKVSPDSPSTSITPLQPPEETSTSPVQLTTATPQLHDLPASKTQEKTLTARHVTSSNPQNDIKKTHAEAHELSYKIITLIHGELLQKPADESHGKAVEQLTQQLFEKLSTVKGFPDTFAILDQLEQQLLDVEQQLLDVEQQSQKNRSILEIFWAPKGLIKNKSAIRKTINRVKQQIDTQPSGPQGHFSIEASTKVRNEIINFVQGTAKDEANPLGICGQFRIDALRQRFTLSAENFSYDSSLTKEELKKSEGSEDHEDQKQDAIEKMTQVLEEFTKEASEAHRFAISLLTTQTMGNAMFFGLTKHHVASFTGSPTIPMSFSTKSNLSNVHKNKDGSLHIECSIKGSNVIIQTQTGKSICYSADSSILLKASITLPKGGTIEDMQLGPVQYTLNLPGAYLASD